MADGKLSLQYGDGQWVNGTKGSVDLTIGNLTVKHQEMGLATHINQRDDWNPFGAYSGVFGLMHPTAIKAHDASQPNHNTVLENLVSDGPKITSFSMATKSKSNSSTGYLAFGGLPPVSYTAPFVSVPMQSVSGSPSSGCLD